MMGWWAKAALLFVGVLAAVVSQGEAAATVMATLEATPELSSFAEAVTAANLAAQLSAPTFVGTIFAPNNEAFEKLYAQIPKATLVSSPVLPIIIRAHIVPQLYVTKAEMTNGMNLATLVDNQALLVSIGAGNGTAVKTLLTPGNVVKPDILAGSAIIHEVDGVLIPLLPAQIQAAQAAANGQPAPGAGGGAPAAPQPTQPAPLIQWNGRRLSS